MRALILLACVGSVLADECGPLQRSKVKYEWIEMRMWSQATQFKWKELLVEFWKRFFSLAPGARDLSPRIRSYEIFSPEFTAHGYRVFGGIDMAINLLDQPDVQATQLDHMKRQHSRWNIPEDHWPAFKRAIQEVLLSRLGHASDRDAWDACVDVILNGVHG